MTTGVRAADHGSPAPPLDLPEEVAEACRVLAEAASGRVFAVPEDGVESALHSEWARGARYDTVLSFMRTPRVTDVEGFVAAMERILAEGGWIFMVEPSAARAGTMRARLGSRLESARRTVPSGLNRLGSRLEAWPGRRSPLRSAGADVVAALRSGGLVVTDLHRRRAPSAPTARRHYVVLRARRESPPVVGL